VLTAILALLAIGAATAAVIAATSPSTTTVKLREVGGHDVHEVANALSELVSENTR
jgi:TRAP-type C4-dicarboxylate transport system substrate-binding protein